MYAMNGMRSAAMGMFDRGIERASELANARYLRDMSKVSLLAMGAKEVGATTTFFDPKSSNIQNAIVYLWRGKRVTCRDSFTEW